MFPPNVFRRICASVLVFAVGSSVAIGQTLQQRKADAPGFRSDGCSMFPDGCYRDCCEAHDLDYFFGGTRDERRESDKRLYQCVRKKKGWGHRLLAPLMWIGVRIGGIPFLPTPFRWGFGKDRKSKEKKPPPAPVTDASP